MNNVLRAALIFGAGVLTGVIGTRLYYGIGREVEFENLPGDDISETNPEEEEETEVEESQPDAPMTPVYEKPGIDDILKKTEEIREHINEVRYRDEIKPYETTVSFNTRHVPVPEGPVMNVFRVISEDEFMSLADGTYSDSLNPYAEYSITYYANEKLVDENGCTFDNPEWLIGEEAMDILSRHDYDEPYMYVADDQEQCVYEIMICDTEFADSALEED